MKVNGKPNMSGAYPTASQGKKPNMAGTNPKASAGRNTGLNGSTGGSKSPVMSGGGKPKAGNHAAMRKPY